MKCMRHKNEGVCCLNTGLSKEENKNSSTIRKLSLTIKLSSRQFVLYGARQYIFRRPKLYTFNSRSSVGNIFLVVTAV